MNDPEITEVIKQLFVDPDDDMNVPFHIAGKQYYTVGPWDDWSERDAMTDQKNQILFYSVLCDRLQTHDYRSTLRVSIVTTFIFYLTI